MHAPTVSEACQRFARRLRSGVFAREAARAWFGLAVVAATLLLAARFAPQPWLRAVAAAPGWAPWAVVLLVGAAWGWTRAARAQVDERFVVCHLERRLDTDGLLLAAYDGAELDAGFRERLGARLGALAAALPSVRWQRLLLRPAAAAAVLGIAQLLPPVDAAAAAGEATAVAIARLAEEVEQLAAEEEVSPQVEAELRAAARDLRARAEAGDEALWREIDQLGERLDRERALARGEGPAESPAAGGRPGGDATPPTSAALAEAMQRLGAADGEALRAAVAGLPDELAEAVRDAAAAATSGEPVDPASLPTDDDARRALGDALAGKAGELLADPDAMQAIAEALGADAAQDAAAQLAELAQAVGGAERAADGSSPLPDAGALADGVAEMAAELASAGALEALPQGLRESMLEAAAGALENLDVEALARLLPDDLSALQGMAESLAGLAEQMGAGGGPEGGGEPSAQPAGAPPQLPDLSQLSPETMQKLARMAEGLRERMGGGDPADGAGRDAGSGALGEGRDGSAGGEGRGPGVADGRGGDPGGSSDGSGPDGSGPDGSGPDGSGPGGGGPDGGGHAALRLTEDTPEAPGAGEEFTLPGQAEGAPLPDEWVPVSAEKVAPEVGEATPTSARATGRAGAAPASDEAAANWQRRLMPRHRDVVRRFFGEKKED